MDFPSPISFQTRRRFAESRVGAIIHRLVKSRYLELYGLVFGALVVLAFWGTNAEGQKPLFDNMIRQYIEEKAVTLNLQKYTPNHQSAEIDGMFAGMGGDSAAESPSPTMQATTIRDSAIVAMAPPDVDYIDQLSSQRSQITEYTVQDGDLLSFIASDFGVSINSIIWANNLKDANSISPGQILKIPPITGVIHVAVKGDTTALLAQKYSAQEDRIIAYNHLPKDGTLQVGQEVIVPDGKVSPAAAARSSSVRRSTEKMTVATILERGIPITQALIRRVGTYTEAGSQLTARLFSYLPDLGDYFTNPTSGFNWGILHDRNGVDEANSCGTPVDSAADGVVTTADSSGWNGGFGRYIKIAHPNGTETLYGHLSRILIKVGQTVGRSQKIGLMGSTGRSTGCHLHFEVHGARNPLAQY